MRSSGYLWDMRLMYIMMYIYASIRQHVTARNRRISDGREASRAFSVTTSTSR
jgi:hypothetical protein